MKPLLSRLKDIRPGDVCSWATPYGHSMRLILHVSYPCPATKNQWALVDPKKPHSDLEEMLSKFYLNGKTRGAVYESQNLLFKIVKVTETVPYSLGMVELHAHSPEWIIPPRLWNRLSEEHGGTIPEDVLKDPSHYVMVKPHGHIFHMNMNRHRAIQCLLPIPVSELSELERHHRRMILDYYGIQHPEQ